MRRCGAGWEIRASELWRQIELALKLKVNEESSILDRQRHISECYKLLCKFYNCKFFRLDFELSPIVHSQISIFPCSQIEESRGCTIHAHSETFAASFAVEQIEIIQRWARTSRNASTRVFIFYFLFAFLFTNDKISGSLAHLFVGPLFSHWSRYSRFLSGDPFSIWFLFFRVYFCTFLK